MAVVVLAALVAPADLEAAAQEGLVVAAQENLVSPARRAEPEAPAALEASAELVEPAEQGGARAETQITLHSDADEMARGVKMASQEQKALTAKMANQAPTPRQTIPRRALAVAAPEALAARAVPAAKVDAAGVAAAADSGSVAAKRQTRSIDSRFIASIATPAT